MAFNQVARAALFALGLTTAASAPVLAQQGLDEPFQKPFKDALAGKTVAFVPVAMNIPTILCLHIPWSSSTFHFINYK